MTLATLMLHRCPAPKCRVLIVEGAACEMHWRQLPWRLRGLIHTTGRMVALERSCEVSGDTRDALARWAGEAVRYWQTGKWADPTTHPDEDEGEF